MFKYRSIIATACCAAMGSATAATTVCVTNVADFQTALDNATGSTSTTLIQVARGDYSVGATPLVFNATTASQAQLDISGGYDSDCSAQIKNPALTILDGGGAHPVLRLISAGGISVRYLTVQNGFLPTNTGAGNAGLYADSQTAGLIVNYNIIRNNVGFGDAGLEAIVGNNSTSALHVEGNLIVGNTAQNQDGAGSIVNNGSGDAYITNNTVANNISQRTDAGAVGGLYIGSGQGSTALSNNICWNNTTADFYLAGSPVFVDNDYAAVSPPGGRPAAGSTGNVDVDPQFVSGTDFHLLVSSPLLGAGTLTPPGNLPAIDIEGHPRSYNNLVDMGAYERGDIVFADSFDN
jgi:hypothetical protein